MPTTGARGASTTMMASLVIVVVVAAAFAGYYYLRMPSTDNSTMTVVPLRVFAAASFTYALQALQASYQQNNSVSLIYNFAGSGALETQISQGSPCDVFMSADATNNAKLKTAGLLADNDTYSTLVYNSIAVYVQPGNPKNIQTLADLLKPGVRVVVEASSVPAGAYTAQVWQNIQSRWGNSSSPDFKSTAYANYTADIKQHVVSYATDVETAVQQVVTGAADAGFAYVSDEVPQGAKIVQISVPSDVNVRAVYTISVIKSTAYSTQAHQLVNWLLSKEGQAFLARWGFIPITPGS